jgi:hypothetical protein
LVGVFVGVLVGVLVGVFVGVLVGVGVGVFVGVGVGFRHVLLRQISGAVQHWVPHVVCALSQAQRRRPNRSGSRQSPEQQLASL